MFTFNVHNIYKILDKSSAFDICNIFISRKSLCIINYLKNLDFEKALENLGNFNYT